MWINAAIDVCIYLSWEHLDQFISTKLKPSTRTDCLKIQIGSSSAPLFDTQLSRMVLNMIKVSKLPILINFDEWMKESNLKTTFQN